MGDIRTSIEGNIVVNIATDKASLTEIFQYIENHIDLWTDRQVIWDLSDINFDAIQFDHLHQFVQKGRKITKKREGLKTAVIAKSDLAFGMMRMLSTLAEGQFHFNMSVFRTIDEARKWLQTT